MPLPFLKSKVRRHIGDLHDDTPLVNVLMILCAFTLLASLVVNNIFVQFLCIHSLLQRLLVHLMAAMAVCAYMSLPTLVGFSR